MSWTHPYGIWWDKAAHGLAISHIEESEYYWGPERQGAPPGTNKYYINPVGRKSMGLSATEFDDSTTLELDALDMFTVNVTLAHDSGKITFPLAQGQAFNTAVYNGVTLVIQTGLFFENITESNSSRQGIVKYKTLLRNGQTWLIYIIPNEGTPMVNMATTGVASLIGDQAFFGVIQIAKIPCGNDVSKAEEIYDKLAGTYAVGATLSGTVARWLPLSKIFR